MGQLDEHYLTLTNLNAQRHVTPFKEEIEGTIKTLLKVSDILDSWIKVQKLWTNLEEYSTTGDIAA